LIDAYFIDDSEYDIWDQYVSTHPDATPYHFTSWNLSINKAYNHDIYFLIAKQVNKVCGILPLCRLKPPFMSGVVCASPFCDLGGTLCDDERTRDILIRQAVSFIQKSGIPELIIRERPVNKISHYHEEVLSGKKVSMLLQLPDSSNILLSQFKSKLRSQIKKAEKNGLEFDLGNTESHLLEFYSVFSCNMRHLGSPTHSFEWFKQILYHYRDYMSIGLVYYENVAIGSGLLLRTGKTCFIPWASTISSYNPLAPNMMLYWNLLKYASDSGCELFDFGRSTYGEGTYKFKKQWGACPVPLVWTILDSEGSTITDNSSASRVRSFAESIWQMLPLDIANRLGPQIRKYISL